MKCALIYWSIAYKQINISIIIKSDIKFQLLVRNRIRHLDPKIRLVHFVLNLSHVITKDSISLGQESKEGKWKRDGELMTGYPRLRSVYSCPVDGQQGRT